MNKIIHYIIIPLLLLILFGIFPAFSSSRIESDPILKSRANSLLRKKIRIDQFNAVSGKQFIADQIAYSCALKALELATGINYSKGIAEANYNLGKYSLVQKDYLSTMKYALTAYDLATHIGNTLIRSESLNLIGSVYCLIKRDDLAIRYFELALKAAQKIKDTNQIIFVNLNFSFVYAESNNVKPAERYLYTSLFLSLKQHNKFQEALLYKRLGNFYLGIKEYDKALYYYSKSISLYSQLNQRFQAGSIYTLIAHTYEQKRDFPSALNFNKLALEYRLTYNHDEQVSSSYVNLGYTFLEMDQLDSALYYLLTGTKQAMVFMFFRNGLLERGYRNLYLLYRKKNDPVNSLKYFKLYSAYQDSVDDEKNKLKISMLETNHFMVEKDKETKALKDENFIQKLEAKNRNLYLLLLIMFSLLAIGLAVYIQQALIKNQKEKKKVEEINDQLQDEIEEQVIQNKELSQREQEYRFLADHSADLITLMDSNFKCIYISPSCEYFLGYSPEELMILEDYRKLIHPDSLNSFGLEFESMIEYRDATRFLYQVFKKDGSAFWVESNINPIFDSSTKELKAMLSISRDVSSQIDQEEALMEATRQKELLIREVHHRVKNNLTILTSLVNMQMGEFTDHKTLDVFSDLQFRVRAMALVHEQLYKNRNIKTLSVGEYLSNLVRIVSSAFSTTRIQVHLDIYEEILDVETLLPMGLIVNELLTNAFKYAFPDKREGNIWVSYAKATPNKKGIEMRLLTVKDDGVGLPPEFTFAEKTSMGSQIIDLLSKQLEAKIMIDGTKGASFSLLLPLEK